MNYEKTKIVADSSCDVLSLSNISFEYAPMKIITSQNEYVDNQEINIQQMVDELQNYKGKSSTSCPNTGDWISAFGDADYIFCITITATLSGSYNSAIMAKEVYEELYPNRRVFILNSLTAGPEIALIIDKLQELILEGHEFENVCREISEYAQNTGLLFMLKSMKNLANNGRVSPFVAKMAGLLGIRVVGKASDKGDLEPLNKCRGEQNALETIADRLREYGLKNGKVKIAHCFNITAAESLKQLLLEKFDNARVEIYECRGLCSFYAEKGGMLVGFEKN